MAYVLGAETIRTSHVFTWNRLHEVDWFLIVCKYTYMSWNVLLDKRKLPIGERALVNPNSTLAVLKCTSQIHFHWSNKTRHPTNNFLLPTIFNHFFNCKYIYVRRQVNSPNNGSSRKCAWTERTLRDASQKILINSL